MLPWWEYFLGVLVAAYDEFESRVGMVASGRGAKSALVRRMVENSLGEFTVSELMNLCPGVSKDLVRSILDQMKAEGKAECLSRGHFARWRRNGQYR